MAEDHSGHGVRDRIREHRKCDHCHSDFDIVWIAETTDLEPSTCPFCGFEIVESEDENEDNEERIDQDSWD